MNVAETMGAIRQLKDHRLNIKRYLERATQPNLRYLADGSHEFGVGARYNAMPMENRHNQESVELMQRQLREVEAEIDRLENLTVSD